MNSVILIGNLTRDPELRYSTGQNQTAVCRFTVAVNDGFGDRQRTSFIPIVVFGKTAENCDRYLKKGSKVCVNGKIQTGSYEKDGRTVYTTEVIANTYGGVEFLSSSQGGGYQPQESYGAPAGQPQGGQAMDIPNEGFTSLQDDDIPF